MVVSPIYLIQRSSRRKNLLGVIDAIVAEPEGGAHTDADAAALLLEQGILKTLEEIDGLEPDVRRRRRRAKYRVMGVLAPA